MDFQEFIEQVKIPFKAEYKEKVKSKGYDMSLGVGFGKENYSLEVRLSPLEGSLDPILTDLFDGIKKEILPEQYKGGCRECRLCWNN